MSRTYARALHAPGQPVLGDALFFAAVFVLVAIVFGLVGLLFKSTVFNAIEVLATSYVAARLTARRFARKHGRPLRAERMPLLLWCALLIFVMSLVGVSLMVEAYNNQLFNFRKLSGGFTLAASVAGTLAHLPVLWLAYWIVGRNDGEDDASGPESPRAGASTGAAPRSVALQKVLVIGGGGREHALAWKLAQSRRTSSTRASMSVADTPTLRHLRSVAVPALPGATRTSATRRDCASFHARACSRPPPPITSTFCRATLRGAAPVEAPARGSPESLAPSSPSLRPTTQ